MISGNEFIAEASEIVGRVTRALRNCSFGNAGVAEAIRSQALSSIAVPDAPRATIATSLQHRVGWTLKGGPAGARNTSLGGTIWLEAVSSFTVPRNTPWAVISVRFGYRIGRAGEGGRAARYIWNTSLGGTILLEAFRALTIPYSPRTAYSYDSINEITNHDYHD